jgi:hypothetical protein
MAAKKKAKKKATARTGSYDDRGAGKKGRVTPKVGASKSTARTHGKATARRTGTSSSRK